MIVRMDPLKKSEDMIALIARVTGEPTDVVRERLARERREGGVSVREAFAAGGGTPFVYDEAMARFYEETDAFVYELAVWNANGFKKQMGRWVARWLKERTPGPRRVLSIGDGLGFEALRLARKGHDVTYFELPGVTARFARELIAESGVALTEEPDASVVPGRVTYLTDPGAIPSGTFDALVCLDVLEHVPDVPGFLAMILKHLKPGGVLFAHAPFYMIHRSYPTHLRASRRYAGSVRLYRDAGLRLLDGQPMWNPLVWQTPGGEAVRGSALRRAALRVTQPWLMCGRVATWPLLPVHWAKPWRQG